jgi:ABC-type sulfate/molybdate transport systems ATPase subunit
MDLFADITLPRRSFDLRVRLELTTETVALVGPSGAGKTSLLRALAGLEHPTGGRIALGDEVWLDVARRIDVAPEHRRVGYLPQDYALFPHQTVAGNVRFAARRDRIDLLERVGVAHLAAARPAELSGGERQRVALARALAREPEVLLLDEPFAALDAITREQVRGELAALLPELRLPTLVVTHAFDDATTLADRIGVLDQGELVQLGSAEELVKSPASVLVARLTGANTLAGTAQRDRRGVVVRLADGGELQSAGEATGEVQVAVYPWDVELTAPNGCSWTDSVVSVRPERGTLHVRLTRLTVRVPASANGAPELTPGARVGIHVTPEDVRVFS